MGGSFEFLAGHHVPYEHSISQQQQTQSVGQDTLRNKLRVGFWDGEEELLHDAEQAGGGGEAEQRHAEEHVQR